MSHTRTSFRGSGALLRAAAALVAALLALGEPSAAQTTSSSIRGVVLDETGPIAGATVTAVDVNSGFRYSAISGEDGAFGLAGLRPGVFDLTVQAGAHAPQTRRVQVLVAQDVVSDFVLTSSQGYAEEVSVVAETTQLLIETETSEIATNVTQQQIESLPQNSRNFLSFAQLAPGVRFTDDQDKAGQNYRSGGQDPRQVNVFIDGLSYKNDLLQGGAMSQDSSRGNPFPQNAVQEYRVLTQNYKAEYEKAAAAVISAITKSGGNAFHGDLFYAHQDKDLVSQDDFARERNEEEAEYDRKQGGLSIGGPILQDKLHFFASYETNEQDRNATVFRGADFANAPANVQDFLSGFETGVLTAPFESDLFFGKLSWQPADFQTVDVSFNLRDEQEVRGFGGQRVLQGAESFEIGTDALVAKHTWVVGNLLNEAALASQSMQWAQVALDASVPHQNYIGILDIGGKDATQDFQQDRLALRDDLTWATTWRGDHVVKGGVSAAQLDYDITKFQQNLPLYEFRSDEDWQFPFQARIGFGDPSLDFSNEQYGVYLQDDWAVLDNLTLNLGVRWDYESNMINNDFVTPPAVLAAMHEACRTYGQPVGGQSTWCLDEFFDFDSFTTNGSDRDAYTGMVQPRLGFAWDVREDGKTVVFGGWGKYYDRVVLNDIFDEQFRHSWTVYSFCFSADGSPAPNCGAPTLQWLPEYGTAEGLRALIASGQAPGPEIFMVNNDMRPPRSDQWTLGVRQQLGDWLGSLAYANVRGYNGLVYFFGDLPPGTAFGDRFGGNVQIPGYGRLFTTSTTRRTWYDGVYLTLDKPLAGDSNWGFNLAYTYADAEQNGTDFSGEGIAFGAFDYRSAEDFYRFPASGSEKHRIVASGTVVLPAGFQVSSMLTLGSGVPFTIFDDSHDPFTVRWNEGTPPQDDFLGVGDWAYQSIDLRLQWTAPPIADRVRVSLIGEGFNLEDHDNYGCIENFKPRLPSVNERFGEGNCEFSTRRFQVGARLEF